jgi:hypothetical protein
MIPSTSILFNDDGTAWWVAKPIHRLGVTNTAGDDYDDPTWFASLDRPCDTCGGDGWMPGIDRSSWACLDCGGTGRHTFTIEVGSYHRNGIPDDPSVVMSFTSHRVSVVPDMVLRLTDEADDLPPQETVIEMWRGPDGPLGSIAAYNADDGEHYHQDSGIDMVDERTGEPLFCFTIPPDAKPGMWAVKLQVQP